MKTIFSILTALVLILVLPLSSCNNQEKESMVESAEVRTEANNRQETENPSAAQKTHPATDPQTTAKKPADPMKTGNLQWMTIEQAANIPNKGSKKYLVDVYTDWCGWCKVMDKKTFTDPEVQAYLEENFHIIKFNAEQKEVVEFRGKKYEWKAAGRNGINTLAVELLGNRLSYPTLVYLDKNMNKIRSSPGFKQPDQLLEELKVIAGS